MIENYQSLRKLWFKKFKTSRKQQLKKNLIQSATKKHNEINNFYVFQALRYNSTYSIDYDTSEETIDKLIREAKRTQRFTIVCHYKYGTDIKFIYIEFVQSLSSHIVSIPFTLIHSMPLYKKIDMLLSQIFIRKNVLQIWGNIDYDIMNYMNSKQLSLNFFNTQEKFKDWYNETFVHSDDCPQISIDEYTDGETCTCGHRPYKSLKDKWSLSRALTFVFEMESSDHLFNEVYECFAITKFAKIIREDWSIQDIELYMDMQCECDDDVVTN